MKIIRGLKSRVYIFGDRIKKIILNPVTYARSLGVHVGNHCVIYPEVFFGSEPYLIQLGNNVRITRGVKFITHDGGIFVLRNTNQLPDADIFGRIIIGNNVHIGMNSIIMPGVIIGNNVIIGCGAVVTKNIPDNSVVAGVPAKVIKTLDEYYEKQKEHCVFTKHMTPKEKKAFLKKKFNI